MHKKVITGISCVALLISSRINIGSGSSQIAVASVWMSTYTGAFLSWLFGSR